MRTGLGVECAQAIKRRRVQIKIDMPPQIALVEDRITAAFFTIGQGNFFDVIQTLFLGRDQYLHLLWTERFTATGPKGEDKGQACQLDPVRAQI